jgi:hypothetical protein
VKTALYQGVGRIIRGVFSRGGVFLHKPNIRSNMLRGEGGHNIRTIHGYWGGVYPDTPEVGDRGRAGRGLSRGIARARGEERGGDTP